MDNQLSIPTRDASPYLDTPEAAAYLRMEARTLINWRSRGGGPAYRKHGGRVYYRLRELDAWSDSRIASGRK